MLKHYLLATSTLLAVTISASAHAQTASGTTAAASNTIEELVVTAEKREQNLQDVPVAISAFTSEKRDLLGIKSIQDLTNFTPGLNYTSGNDRTTLRGVGRLTNAHPVAVPVAVYDDGIYTTSTTTAGKSPIFTDRVEILRGPQGTLYGRNSIGGAINVISKRPTTEPYAEVRATIANFKRTLLEAAVSGPVADNLQFRLAGNWEKQDEGYYKNVVPGMPSEGNVIDQWFIEGQLQAKFGDRLDGWAKFSMQGWNNGSGGPGARSGYSPGPYELGEYGSSYVNMMFACAPGAPAFNVVDLAPNGCTNPASSDPRKFASLIAQTVSLDNTYTGAVNLTYHFDNMDLKYVAGGLNYHYKLVSDNSDGGAISSYQIHTVTGFPPATIFPKQLSNYQEIYQNYSHELSLASTSKSALQWIGGLYYYEEKYDQPVYTQQPDNTALDGAVIAAAPTLTGPVDRDFQRRLFDNRPSFDQRSYAAYGQVDWQFTPEWKATLGLRYSHDSLKGEESVRVICWGTSSCGAPVDTLGAFAPPIDVTAAVVNLANVPQGVVDNGHRGGITFTSDGFAHRAYDASWSATTGTAGIQWDPAPETMLYLRYSRGYLMGGFASGVTSTEGQFPFTDAEHSDDFEAGIKKTFGRTLQVNLDLFYNPIKGYQAPLTVANNSGGLIVSQSRYLNIPKVLTAGVELETIWQPIQNLQILFNYAYDDAEVKSLCGVIDPSDPEALQPGAKPVTSCGSGPLPVVFDANANTTERWQDLKGDQLPQVPKNKVSLAATYTFNFEAGSLTPEVSYIWRDKQYSGLFTRAIDAAPSWSQTDLRVTWKDKDNHYSIIAYVANVFDDLGYDGGASASRRSGVFYDATIAALGLTPGTAGRIPGTHNAVQGLNTSFALHAAAHLRRGVPIPLLTRSPGASPGAPLRRSAICFSG
jgi:iron complex outermembrane receptor protein